MINAKYLPVGSFIKDNKYTYEIDVKQNHVVSQYETCVVYQGRRYVCGHLHDQNEVNKKHSQDIKKEIEKEIDIFSRVGAVLLFGTIAAVSAISMEDVCDLDNLSILPCSFLSITSVFFSVLFVVRMAKVAKSLAED